MHAFDKRRTQHRRLNYHSLWSESEATNQQGVAVDTKHISALNGNCREVFEFYKSVFGGEFSIFMTFADGPAEMQFPDAERDNVMHVSFPIGSSVLMGSDIPSAHGDRFSAGNNFSITHASKSRKRPTHFSPSSPTAVP